MCAVKNILFTIGLATPLALSAQHTTGAKFFERGMVSSSFISQKSNLQVYTVGSSYYDDQWNRGNIELSNGEKLSNVPIRYDLNKSIVEYKLGGSIKGYSTELINSFSWYSFTIADSVHFISITKDAASDPFKDVFEILVDGEIKLYAQTKLKILEPNYLPTLDLGSPERKIILDEQLFLVNENEIISINKKIKDNLVFFSPFENEIKWFAKEQKLKCKRKGDLIQLVSYLNHLKHTDRMPEEEVISHTASRSKVDLQ